MLIKIYNQKLEYLQVYNDGYNFEDTEELEDDYKLFQFDAPYTIANLIKEQYKIEVNNYVYDIKEINKNFNSSSCTVICKPTLGTLKSQKIDVYNRFGANFKSAIDIILENTNWIAVGAENIRGSYTLNLKQLVTYDAIKTLANMYQAEYQLDTKKRIIYFYESIPNTKTFNLFIDNSTIDFCQIQRNCYDSLTKLIPIGKDGLTIGPVNNNADFIEDYSVFDETIVGYYLQSDISNPMDLLLAAQNKMEEVKQATTVYKIRIKCFEQNIDNVSVGDILNITNCFTKEKNKFKITKLVKYADDAGKSYIEAGDKLVSFDSIYKSYTTAMDNVVGNTSNNLAALNKEYN